MILVLGSSIAIRILAIVWSVILLRRIKDWRIGFLTVMFILMAVRQSLTLWNTPSSTLTDFTLAYSELPGLVVSIMAVLSIFALEKILMAPVKAQENLKEINERFHELTENLDEIFWMTSIDGEQIIYVSPAYENIFGRNLDEFEQNPKVWMDYILPEDRPAVQEAFTESNLVRGNYNVEYRIQRPDGSLRWIKAKGFPVKNELGEIHRIAGIATDITRQKLTELALKNSQAELEKRVEERTADLLEVNENLKSEISERLRFVQALEESEERFRRLFEEGFIGMCVVGPDYYLDNVNQAYCEMVGYTQEELKSMTFMDITFPEDLEKDMEQVRKLENRDISNYQMEKRYIRKDGKIIWINLSVFIIRDLQTEPSYYYIAITEDITQRKEIEEKLVESEGKFRQIAENVEEVFWMEDVEGSNIVYISPAFEKIWGIPLEELIKNPKLWMESIHPEDRPKIEALNLYENRENLLSGNYKSEFRIVRPDGSIRWILDRAFPVYNSKGEPFRIVGISQDVTDLKSAQEKAEKASRAKSEFLSHMSHELRTPLNAILGFAQLLGLDPKKNLSLKQKESVKQIRIAGKHLLELINEVLDLTRIETGSLKVFNENTDVSKLLEKLLPVVERMAQKRGIHIRNQLSETGPLSVFADSTRLKQALINLMTNAIKYNKEGGEVFIRGETTDDRRVKIHIIDTGPGIEADNQQALFEPFKRLGAENSGIEGTGIGLSITQKIVELMNGSVSLKSEVGKGSCFTIELPAGMAPAPVSQESPSNKISFPDDLTIGDPNHQTVLYIEDNISNLELVKKYIEGFTSFQFLASQNPIDGVTTARQHQPALILMDINLPGMDGIQTFKELQKYDETKSIPVIAVSANAMDHDIKSALDAGFKKYVTKPLDLPSLVETIHTTLKIPT